MLYLMKYPYIKLKSFYHIILTEEQMEQFGEDFIIEEESGMGKVDKHRFLLINKAHISG